MHPLEQQLQQQRAHTCQQWRHQQQYCCQVLDLWVLLAPADKPGSMRAHAKQQVLAALTPACCRAAGCAGLFTAPAGIGFKATAVASELTYISSSGYTFAFDMRPGAFDVPWLGLVCPRWEPDLQERMLGWLGQRLAGGCQTCAGAASTLRCCQNTLLLVKLDRCIMHHAADSCLPAAATIAPACSDQLALQTTWRAAAGLDLVAGALCCAGTGVGCDILDGFTTRMWLSLKPDVDRSKLTQELCLLDPYMLLNLRKLK